MANTPALRPLREVNSEPAEPTLYRVVWLLAQIMRVLTKRDWRGQDKIPATGGAVFVINHISNLDPIAFGHYVAYAGRWPRYLGKASLFRIPVIGKIITACGQIPVERHSRDASKALRQAVDAVNSGKCVSVYPEGTITLDPDLWPMVGKSGAVRIAFETGCPVIPIGQWGVQEIMYGKKIHFPRFLPRKKLIFLAGDPVPLDDLRRRVAAEGTTPEILTEATTRVMAAITTLVAEIRQSEPPEHPYDPRRSS